MWIGWFIASIVAFVAFGAVFAVKRKLNVLKVCWPTAVFLSSICVFVPIHSAAGNSVPIVILLSVFNSMQIFVGGCGFPSDYVGFEQCPQQLEIWFQGWGGALFVLGFAFTFWSVLSLFRNFYAKLRYFFGYHRDVYVFSELNDKSLVLANDIKSQNPKATIVFTDVFEDNDESSFEMMEEAKGLCAICFKNDILAADFSFHSRKRAISFFTISTDETENLNQALKLIDRYASRENTHLYVFSTNIESELLLSAKDKGAVKVRRINEVRSLVNRILYEQGEIIFNSALKREDGVKRISAVVVGMGRHGTEMLKALTWFGQMDGYELEINAFDRDPIAEEKFIALAPELTSPEYNGVHVDGEAYYKIKIHPGVDVSTVSFVNEIRKITGATYVFVALGDDEININTAVELRTCFERMKIKPIIQAVVYNSQQKQALRGIKNFKGQEYLIDFIGDVESSYAVDVIIDSDLEDEALQRHLKWGKEEEFWDYEYNYRSSVASAIHMRARIKCGIPGADKRNEELTPEEKNGIEVLEHKRWNAYMRAEGYVFSGSTEKSSRNDLGKMHHDLVDFSSLTEEEKRKDSDIGAQ